MNFIIHKKRKILSGLIFRKNRPTFILPKELPQEKFKTQSNFAHRNFDRAISY